MLVAGSAAALISLSLSAHATQGEDGGGPAAAPVPGTSGPAVAAAPGSRDERDAARRRYAPAWRYGPDDEQEDEERNSGYVVAGNVVLVTGIALIVGSMVVRATDDTQPHDEAQMQLLIDGQVARLSAAGETATPGNVFLPATDKPTTAMAMMAVATGLGVLGIPLVMLGEASPTPESPEGVAAGTAMSTAGFAILGLAATITMAQASYVPVAQVAGQAGDLTVAYDEDRGPVALPLVLTAGGAALSIAGFAVWFSSAGDADGDASDSSDKASRAGAAVATAQLRVTPGALSLVGTF